MKAWIVNAIVCLIATFLFLLHVYGIANSGTDPDPTGLLIYFFVAVVNAAVAMHGYLRKE